MFRPSLRTLLRPTTTTHLRPLSSKTFKPQPPSPSPPRLPAAEQAEFERLQRLSTGAFSQSANTPSEVADALKDGVAEQADRDFPSSSSTAASSSSSSSSSSSNNPADVDLNVKVNVGGADGSGSGSGGAAQKGQAQQPEEQLLHPNIRRGAPPEFEGDKNPKTGEVGGPKTEPLRWGGEGDWSYSGRVTDF